MNVRATMLSVKIYYIDVSVRLYNVLCVRSFPYAAVYGIICVSARSFATCGWTCESFFSFFLNEQLYCTIASICWLLHDVLPLSLLYRYLALLYTALLTSCFQWTLPAIVLSHVLFGMIWFTPSLWFVREMAVIYGTSQIYLLGWSNCSLLHITLFSFSFF